MKKGQMSFEYMIALILFLSLTMFMFSQVNQKLPQLHTKSVSNKLKAEAYSTTSLLISKKNYTLVNKKYETDRTAVDNFITECEDNYQEKKNELGLENRNFHLIFYENGSGGISKIGECGKEISSEAEKTTVYRFLDVGNNWGKLKFELW